MGKKYEDCIFKITDIDFPNKGIGTWEDKVVTVKNVIPGQTVCADVKKKKQKYEGRLKTVTERADYEGEPTCEHFEKCGGCTYRTISYEKELEIKRDMVLKLLKTGGIEGFVYDGIKGSPDTEGYRNKMEFSFGDNGEAGELCLGMRKRNSNYEVVNADKCKLTHADVGKIVGCVLDFFRGTDETFYHRMRHTGTLRHLLVRRGFFSGQIVIGIVTTSELKADLNALTDKILSLDIEGKIEGVMHIVNDGVADVVKADRIETLYGKDWFYESLLGLKFKVSLFSFFQTNSAGAEVLYSVVRDYAGDGTNKTIFDMYCGTGTIAQLMSKNADRVIGIELVEEAVEAAKVNAELNGITNCKFIAGDVLKMVDSLDTKPDIMVLDPPREGIHPKAIDKLVAFDAQTIVYVSCKASSMAKDLKVFEENGYIVERVTNVDMFPHTYHTETVCLLSKKDKL
jgi:23S rRNA (uracil-5-)-methyltransferase RumA